MSNDSFQKTVNIFEINSGSVYVLDINPVKAS